MLKNHVLRVNLIQNSVGIVLVTGRENHHLPLLANSFEETYSVGTDRQTQFHVPAIDQYTYLQVGLHLTALKTVNQCLIQV